MANVCFFRLGATPLFVAGSTKVFGGAEVRAFTFAQALARQSDHEVSFAVAADDHLHERVGGIELRAVPRKRKAARKLYSSLHRRVSDRPLPYEHFELIDAEVIACFGVHDPTASVIEAARRRSRQSMLFLTSSEDVKAEVEGTAKIRRHRQSQVYAIRNADEIVVQTEYQRQKLLDRFGRESTLIRNPIDTSTDLKIVTAGQHALWVGRADRDSKRADICFSVARACPDTPFVVVMNDSSSEVYRELTASLPPNVTVHRHVPLDQIESLFATASVLMNTSESEGFPNTFLQAAKYGVPIVSLRVDPDGMLTQRGCGVVAGNQSSMVQWVSAFHAGGEQATRISAVARDYVVRHHELTARADELAQAISSLRSKVKAA